MKKIDIIQGDEFRAKIEQTLENDIIFEDVYRDAYKITMEIVNANRKYANDFPSGEYPVKYDGMGNNIITFDGGRGQGKTSAMQSYARFLRGETKDCGLFDNKDLINNERFYVLDSISPSSLESNENLIRVIISRLFFEVQKKTEDKMSEIRCSKKLIEDRAMLVELFQQCYTNIDYLKLSKSNNDTYDDLETLANLGNSAKLKSNLHDLVDKALVFLCGKEIYNHTFLVIQIDDLDLFRGNVFNICEDIHNYLSIPNVIVMLAADYTQLTPSIYMDYLKSYNEIRNTELGDKMRNECLKMAVRYLEKVFPMAHRVQLPTINTVVMREHENIRISYLNTEGKEVLFNESYIGCRDIQEQIFRAIFMRTGILFLKQSGELHPMLPHTFRELNHFIKLLADMPPVSWKSIYGTDKQEEKNNISIILRNLDKLKLYYNKYWIQDNLHTDEQELLESLDESISKMNIMQFKEVIKQILLAADTTIDKKELEAVNTWQKAINFIKKHNLEWRSDIVYAAGTNISINLSDYYYREAMSNTAVREKFMGLLGGSINTEQLLEAAKHNTGYKIFNYSLEPDFIVQYIQYNNTERYIKYLQKFCTLQNDKKEITFERLKSKNCNIQFNLFNPIQNALYENITFPDIVENVEISEDKGVLTAQRGTDKSSVIGNKLLFHSISMNYDVQKYIQTDLMDKYASAQETDSKISNRWKKVLNGLFGWTEASALNKDSELTSNDFEETYNQLPDYVFRLLFFGCKENRSLYADEYRNVLNKKINELRAFILKATSMKQTEEKNYNLAELYDSLSKYVWNEIDCMPNIIQYNPDEGKNVNESEWNSIKAYYIISNNIANEYKDYKESLPKDKTKYTDEDIEFIVSATGNVLNTISNEQKKICSRTNKDFQRKK